MQRNSVRLSHGHARRWNGEWTNISRTIPHNRNRHDSENVGSFPIWPPDMAASWMKFYRIFGTLLLLLYEIQAFFFDRI